MCRRTERFLSISLSTSLLPPLSSTVHAFASVHFSRKEKYLSRKGGEIVRGARRVRVRVRGSDGDGEGVRNSVKECSDPAERSRCSYSRLRRVVTDIKTHGN